MTFTQLEGKKSVQNKEVKKGMVNKKQKLTGTPLQIY